MSIKPIPRHEMSQLYVACDHAGLPLKEHLLQAIPELPWQDLGTFSADSVDYPDFAGLLCKKMEADPKAYGVLLCGSGQGMAIKANRFSFIRAALCWTTNVAQLAREHNNANVLCLGARIVSTDDAEKILLTFLDTAFAGGRHESRVNKLWSTE